MRLTDRKVYVMLRDAVARGDDRTLMDTVAQHRAQGLGWRYDGLSDWSTDAIFEKLQELDVHADEASFRSLARTSGSCQAITQSWRKGGRHEGAFWDDFLLLAPEELWGRLMPELLCPEIISNGLDDVIRTKTNFGPDRREAEAAAALRAMQYLESFPPGERSGRFDELNDCSIYDYGNWLLDFVLSNGRTHPDAAMRVADVMSDFADAENFQGFVALGLAEAGRRDEAAARARANLDRFPHTTWNLIHAADVYHELKDHDSAVGLLIQAMHAATDPAHWDAADQRLDDFLAEAGRTTEGQAIRRAHPKPARRPPPEPVAPRRMTAVTGGSREADRDFRGKIGRNDPCPCGSGKKYKKCCM